MNLDQHEWFGGHEHGTLVFVKHLNRWRFRFRNHEKNFKTREEGIAFKSSFNMENNLITNRVRYISKTVMEMDLGSDRIMVFDAGDYEAVRHYNWTSNNCNVSSRSKNHAFIFHRFILGVNGPQSVIHLNGNPFDNRRINLKIENFSRRPRTQKQKTREKFPIVAVLDVDTGLPFAWTIRYNTPQEPVTEWFYTCGHGDYKTAFDAAMNVLREAFENKQCPQKFDGSLFYMPAEFFIYQEEAQNAISQNKPLPSLFDKP